MIKFEKLKKSKNIAELLEDDELGKISQRVMYGYEVDRESRADWEDVIEKAMDIAKQTLDQKNFPWANASNIKFPLITKGGIDFASRVMPEVIKNDRVVKVAINGYDPEGLLARRGTRVQDCMSFQLLKQSDDWEHGMDNLFSVLPILGTVFKKTYYDPIEGKNVSDMCLPMKVVVNYNISSLERARRITHEFTSYANDIVERSRAGLYCDIDIEKLKMGEGYADDVYDPPMDLIEQHCWLDLDEDGYEEPYIVVLHKQSRQILRIVNRFNKVKKEGGEILKITAKEYFTDFHFLPAPDGGFYSMGFGTLLYPLNAAINTIFNQLVDSGTLHNNQSGFIGRGLRLKSGEFKMKLGEWKVLDAAAGTNIQQNVVPLPTKEPSSVLFQLLGLLMEIGKDLTSTNDALEGKAPAQNVAATTMLTLVQQGMKVHNAIIKRVFRALKKEFKKLYELNKEYLTDEEYQRIMNDPRLKVKDDFECDSYDVLPVADPNMSSDVERNAKAQALMGIPGLDPYETSKYFLESLQLDQKMIDKLLKKPNPNAPPAPEVLKLQAEIKKFEAQAAQAAASAQDLGNKNQIEIEKLKLLQLDSESRAREAEARIIKMQQDAQQNELKLRLVGAKSDHEAQLKDAQFQHTQAVDQADLSLQSMDRVTKAFDVRAKTDQGMADKQLKAKEIEVKAEEAKNARAERRSNRSE